MHYILGTCIGSLMCYRQRYMLNATHDLSMIVIFIKQMNHHKGSIS